MRGLQSTCVRNICTGDNLTRAEVTNDRLWYQLEGPSLLTMTAVLRARWDMSRRPAFAAAITEEIPRRCFT